MRAIASDDIISTKLISTKLVNIIIKLISQLPITFKLPGKGTIYVTGTSTHHTHTSSRATLILLLLCSNPTQPTPLAPNPIPTPLTAYIRRAPSLCATIRP